MENATAQSEWLTMADCAADIKLGVDVVRRWCIAYEHGDENGLRSTHFGEKVATEESKRLNRRIHRDDWKAFKERRRNAERREERAVQRALEVIPRQYPLRAERKAAVAGRGQ